MIFTLSYTLVYVFFFQAEDGIRDLVRSRGSEMCIRDRTTRVSNPFIAFYEGRIIRDFQLSEETFKITDRKDFKRNYLE